MQPSHTLKYNNLLKVQIHHHRIFLIHLNCFVNTAAKIKDTAANYLYQHAREDKTTTTTTAVKVLNIEHAGNFSVLSIPIIKCKSR
jgi:hypothetical protein